MKEQKQKRNKIEGKVHTEIGTLECSGYEGCHFVTISKDGNALMTITDINPWDMDAIIQCVNKSIDELEEAIMECTGVKEKKAEERNADNKDISDQELRKVS